MALTESKAHREARLAAVAAPESAPETSVVDPKAAERAAREQAKAEAEAAGLRLRDMERGYEAVQWSGVTMYRPIGGGDRLFDTEREAQEHVRDSRVMQQAGGVTP